MERSEIQAQIEALYIVYKRFDNKPEKLKNFFQWLERYGFNVDLLDTNTKDIDYQKEISKVSENIHSKLNIKDNFQEVMFDFLSDCYKNSSVFGKLPESKIAYFISKNLEEIKKCSIQSKEREKVLEFIGKIGEVLIFLDAKDGNFEKAIEDAEKSIEEIKQKLEKYDNAQETKPKNNDFTEKKTTWEAVVKRVPLVVAIIIVLALVAAVVWIYMKVENLSKKVEEIEKSLQKMQIDVEKIEKIEKSLQEIQTEKTEPTKKK